jgi:hypothetical protein
MAGAMGKKRTISEEVEQALITADAGRLSVMAAVME